MITFGKPPYLECSTHGDRRFSAFCAAVNAAGGQTIEAVYQAAKVFPDGVTGLRWQEAKGARYKNRVPINIAEVRQLYASLWTCYIEENPELLPVLRAASGLSDVFGQPGHACQAEELWRIRCDAIATTPVNRLVYNKRRSIVPL